MGYLAPPLIVTQSNTTVFGAALSINKTVYCALLVPTEHIHLFTDDLQIQYHGEISSTKIESHSVRPLATVRPLVSSVCFVFYINARPSQLCIPSISVPSVKGGISIPIAVLEPLVFDTSAPLCTTTLVGSDYRYISGYISHILSRHAGNILIFTDHRMAPEATAFIKTEIDSRDSGDCINIIPVISPYYYLFSFKDSVSHARPADTGLLKQQKDYAFVTLPIVCMLSHLVCREHGVEYLTFADMDERQIVSRHMYSSLANNEYKQHMLIEEINVYASNEDSRDDLNSFMSDDVIFPFGSVLRNRKVFFNTIDSRFALDSPHGIVDDYARYMLLPLDRALYLHFFNVTMYKRKNFAECSSKVNKYINFKAGQINDGLLGDYGLQLISLLGSTES